jgi:hypothetical protein
MAIQCSFTGNDLSVAGLAVAALVVAANDTCSTLRLP